MLKGKYKEREGCRFCGSDYFHQIIDLGWMPLAGDYPKKEEVGKEKYYPLRLYECQECGLVQLIDIVPKENLFQSYVTPYSPSLINHFSDFALEMSKRFLKTGDLVVEIGSNNGLFLRFFDSLKMRTIGFEPVKKIADIAKGKGLKIITDYFGQKSARKIKEKASLIVANNVFAHIDNMSDVMKGISYLLKDDGLFVFEVHSLTDMLDNNLYENIYHEHLSYYNISTLASYLKQWDFEIIEVKRLNTHFGSIRVYAKRYKKGVFRKYQLEIKKNKEQLVKILTDLKKQNKRVIGYGASGKANTLLNYCGITTSLLDGIIDDSPLRYNRFTPGTHIPIYPLKKVDLTKVDCILILAWNYEEDIKEKLKNYKHLKFILAK